MRGRESTSRSATGRVRHATRRTLWIGAGAGLLAQFVLSVGYGLLVVASLRAPSSGLAHLTARLSQGLRPALGPLFEALGAAPCTTQSAQAQQLYHAYIQLIVVDLAIAACCYLACSPCWSDWGRALRRLPRWARARPNQVETELEYGEALALAGALGAQWFLIVAPYPAGACSAPDPWLFLRTPLIITAVYGLACLSAAFGAARAPAERT